MTRRKYAAALIAAALGSLLTYGCNQTNEESLTGRSEPGVRKEGQPEFKSYSEAMQYQAQQAAKNVKGTTTKRK